jgi:hypothetical protein
MRRIVMATGVAFGVAFASVTPALAAPGAPGVPNRPAGPVSPVAPSGNGGDNGWGNCGHNSSIGNPHSDPNGHPGNGGYKKGEGCVANPTDPTDPTGPTTEPTDPGGELPPPVEVY